MEHMPGSLRAEGLTVIATDKPTRAGLKRLAEEAGLPLSLYLRKVVADGEKKGVQRPFTTSPSPLPATKRDIGVLESRILKGEELDLLVLVALGFNQVKPQLDVIRAELRARGELTYMESIGEKISGVAFEGQESLALG